MLKVEGIDHIALAVKDQDASIRWYREVLGLERRHQEVWGDVPAIMTAGTTSLALFPRRPDGETSLPPVEKPGMLHIAFRVDVADFERAQAELRERGIDFTFEDHDIARSIYFRDPDGYRLEITTYDL